MTHYSEIDAQSWAYWQLHPARKASQAVSAAIPHTPFIHRTLWKYRGWPQGFNGGPSRNPTLRLDHGQMTTLRQRLIRAGLDPTADDDAAFFMERHPC